MLVDIATVYYRAYYSQPEWTSPAGAPANAVRGTLDALSYLVDKYQPTDLVTTWDLAWRPEWRVQLMPSYKTARVAEADEEQMPDTLSDQVDLIKGILTQWNIPCVGVKNYESDDLIAQYVRNHSGRSLVVSGDRDLFQLVDDKSPSHVVYIGTGFSKHTYVDEAYIQNRFGIKAAQYADFAILKGDPSDGLPGVSGVGDKTAATLLQTFESVDGILDAAKSGDARIKPRIISNILDAADYLEAAKAVVILNQEISVPAPQSHWRKPTKSNLIDLHGLSRYERGWHQILQA